MEFLLLGLFPAGVLVGWYFGRLAYHWGYEGPDGVWHHVEYWRGWDDRYDAIEASERGSS